MKRTITIILALTMLLSLASCGTGGSPDQSPAPTAETPSAEPSNKPDDRFYTIDINSAYASSSQELVFETETSVYCLCEGKRNGKTTDVVFVSDKEHKDWMPLCGRPDCMHDNENCNAWLEGLAYGKIWLYGRHIWYAVEDMDSEPVLYRMNLDGTDHEKLLKLTAPIKEGYTGKSWDWFFQNKFFIASCLESKNGLDDIERTTFAVDLEKRPFSAEALDILTEEGEPNYIGYAFAGKGELIYDVHFWENESLFETNILTGESRKLCELPFEPGPYSCFLDGKLLYFCDGWETGTIISVDTETGELKTVSCAEPQTRHWYTPYNGIIFGSNDISAEGLAGTEISSFSGELICEIPYEDYGMDIIAANAVGHYVFGYEMHDEMVDMMIDPPIWYLDLDEIGTEGFGWHRWSPDGE